jgi:hypothetical protein
MAAPLQTLVAHPDGTSDEAGRSGMRDPSAPVESPAAAPTSSFRRLDADLLTAGWADLPPRGGSPVRPDRPDKAKSVSRGMLAVGAGLLMFVPVGGALFLAAGVLGLAIASEEPAPTAIKSQPPSPTDQ